jgi:hypothetical protein
MFDVVWIADGMKVFRAAAADAAMAMVIRNAPIAKSRTLRNARNGRFLSSGQASRNTHTVTSGSATMAEDRRSERALRIRMPRSSGSRSCLPSAKPRAPPPPRTLGHLCGTTSRT